MAQLICQDLSIGYEGRAILQHINFSVEKGEYLCIVGENGSGKSTLMKTLLSLQPPVSGKILLGDGLKREEIGYLPQQTMVQKDFPASVREIILSGCQNHCGLRKNWALGICQKGAIGSFPEDSSREFCWPEHYVQPANYYFWMSRFPDWIPRQQKKCTR